MQAKNHHSHSFYNQNSLVIYTTQASFLLFPTIWKIHIVWFAKYFSRFNPQSFSWRTFSLPSALHSSPLEELSNEQNLILFSLFSKVGMLWGFWLHPSIFKKRQIEAGNLKGMQSVGCISHCCKANSPPGESTAALAARHKCEWDLCVCSKSMFSPAE